MRFKRGKSRGRNCSRNHITENPAQRPPNAWASSLPNSNKPENKHVHASFTAMAACTVELPGRTPFPKPHLDYNTISTLRPRTPYTRRERESKNIQSLPGPAPHQTTNPLAPCHGRFTPADEYRAAPQRSTRCSGQQSRCPLTKEKTNEIYIMRKMTFPYRVPTPLAANKPSVSST